MLGDGEMQEGQIYESLMTIKKYDLTNIVIFIDLNKYATLPLPTVLTVLLGLGGSFGGGGGGEEQNNTALSSRKGALSQMNLCIPALPPLPYSNHQLFSRFSRPRSVALGLSLSPYLPSLWAAALFFSPFSLSISCSLARTPFLSRFAAA